jgi:hypothetical protein
MTKIFWGLIAGVVLISFGVEYYHVVSLGFYWHWIVGLVLVAFALAIGAFLVGCYASGALGKKYDEFKERNRS